MPTPKRAAFIMMNMYSRPRFSSPTSVPMAPPWSPNCSTAVGLALMPSLCSIDTQCTSLRSPSEPSSPTWNFGTMNREMPFTPGGASGVRASTRWMMFSAMSCSPYVMKILVPKILYVPSPCGTARVRTAARSEPACGSVRFIVPVHLPVIKGSMKRFFCSSLPAVSIASMAPSVSRPTSANATFDAFSISMHGVATSLGRPWPPNSAGCCTPCQPASAKLRNASLKPFDVVTSPSCQKLGSLSAGWFSGATTSPQNFAFSSRTASTVSGVASSQPGNWLISDRLASSFTTNSMSFRGAL